MAAGTSPLGPDGEIGKRGMTRLREELEMDEELSGKKNGRRRSSTESVPRLYSGLFPTELIHCEKCCLAWCIVCIGYQGGGVCGDSVSWNWIWTGKFPHRLGVFPSQPPCHPHILCLSRSLHPRVPHQTNTATGSSVWSKAAQTSSGAAGRPWLLHISRPDAPDVLHAACSASSRCWIFKQETKHFDVHQVERCCKSIFCHTWYKRNNAASIPLILCNLQPPGVFKDTCRTVYVYIPHTSHVHKRSDQELSVHENTHICTPPCRLISASVQWWAAAEWRLALAYQQSWRQTWNFKQHSIQSSKAQSLICIWNYLSCLKEEPQRELHTGIY